MDLGLKCAEYLDINIVSNAMILEELKLWIYDHYSAILCQLFSRSQWDFMKLVPGKQDAPCSEPAVKVASGWRI